MEALPLGTDRSLEDLHERLQRVLLQELDFHLHRGRNPDTVELAVHLTDRVLDHMGIQMTLDMVLDLR